MIAALITALVALALETYTYKARTNRAASLPMIVAARLIAAGISTLIVAMVALITYATLAPCNFDLNGKEEFTYDPKSSIT